MFSRSIRQGLAALLALLVIATAQPVAATSPYRSAASSVALAQDLPPGLFCRLIGRESDWNPRAVSPSGCLGLGQLNPDVYRLADYFDPKANLAMSARALAWNVDYWRRAAPDVPYTERMRRAVASYNLGYFSVKLLIAEHGDDWACALPVESLRYVELIVGERVLCDES